MLYLPDGRDRLACRRCCGLSYASQYPNVRRVPIEIAPAFTLTITVEFLADGLRSVSELRGRSAVPGEPALAVSPPRRRRKA